MRETNDFQGVLRKGEKTMYQRIVSLVVIVLVVLSLTGCEQIYKPDYPYRVILASGIRYVCKRADLEKRIAYDCDEGVNEIHLGVSDTLLIRYER